MGHRRHGRVRRRVADGRPHDGWSVAGGEGRRGGLPPDALQGDRGDRRPPRLAEGRRRAEGAAVGDPKDLRGGRGMSEATHTPEPWECSRLDFCNREHPHDYFVTGDPSVDAEDDPETDDPDEGSSCVGVAVVKGNATAGDIPRMNAERIVACVNACRGIPTDML